MSEEIQQFKVPSFRVKRPHRKSRLGCIRCKRRRVKCDETRPACTNCTSRGFGCSYEERSGSSRASPVSPSSLDVAGLTTSDASVSDTELMRHFLAHTAEGFATSSDRSEHVELWKVVIPGLAYTYSPVKQGLLTAAALCLYHDALPDSAIAAKYFEAAEYNGERFVLESERQARRFDPSEFSSIIACSRLLSVLGFAFYRSHRANGVVLSDAAAWTWLHLLRGVRTVYSEIRKSGAEVDSIICCNMMHESGQRHLAGCTPGSDEQDHRKHRHFDLIRNTQGVRFQGLLAGLFTRRVDFTVDELNTIHIAIESLEQVTEHICTCEVHSLFLASCVWPASLSTGFVDMLLSNEPFALVVYTHWLMLVALAEEMWWIGDMGVACIREVAALCARTDSGLESLLAGPMMLFELQNESLPQVCVTMCVTGRSKHLRTSARRKMQSSHLLDTESDDANRRNGSKRSRDSSRSTSTV